MIRAAYTAIQCRVLHSLTIISQPFTFVKGFFKTFLSFFRLFSSRSPRLLAERMWSTLYHIRFTLSSTFSKVFQLFSWFPVRRLSRGCPLRDSLHIIALRSPFVNSFFESFSGLAEVAGLYKIAERVLCNVHHFELFQAHPAPHQHFSSKIVQTLFTNFKNCAILCKVKVTERQMRWVKLSETEYFPLYARTAVPPTNQGGLIFLPT